MAKQLMAIEGPAACAECSIALPTASRAWWDSKSASVTFTMCRPVPDGPAASTQMTHAPPPRPPPPPPVAPLDRGTAGVSAQREYERRVAKHEKRIEEKWGTGRIGRVAKILSDEPQSTKAWAKGAEGEARLARWVDAGLGDTATALHDRKVPSTRGNIDHLVIAGSGVWIVDAKNYAGRIERRDVGNWRTVDHRLFVRNRDQTKLVAGLGWQAGAVGVALDAIDHGHVPIRRCLCFTDAEWGLFSKPFAVDGVWIGWPKALVAAISEADPVVDPGVAMTVARHLADWFPAST